MIFSFVFMVAGFAHAEVATYSMNNIIFDSGSTMTGDFSWTYDVGDFENGVGHFSSLEIPYTTHNHTDLNITFDIGGSIEFTLPGNLHDDGVDITLFLVQPLTPDSGSSIDLARSRYDIGGNGFHAGNFLAGNIAPAALSGIGGQPTSPMSGTTLTAYPNPFNPRTKIEFELERESAVRLEIFDLRGRSIRVLDETVHSPGVYSVNWDGTDGFGQSVPSGHYFAVLQAGGEFVSQPMMLVR